MKLENQFNILDILSYSKNSAQTAQQLFERFDDKSIIAFKRKLRTICNEARLSGHRIVGDDSGYYLPVNKEEWHSYKKRRFAAMNDELKALAACDRITVADLIKEIYAVSPTDNNYEMF